jgi:hypothetical protein
MSKYGGIDVGRFLDRTVYIGYDYEQHALVKSVEIGQASLPQQAVFLRPYIDSPTIVDCTGVGQGLFDILQEMKLPVMRMLIHGGHSIVTKEDKTEVLIPKASLMFIATKWFPDINVSRLNVTQRYILELQLRDFIVKPGKKPKFEARTGHDDYITAMASAFLGAYLDGKERRYAGGARQAGRPTQSGSGQSARAGDFEDENAGAIRSGIEGFGDLSELRRQTDRQVSGTEHREGQGTEREGDSRPGPRGSVRSSQRSAG